MDEKQLEDKLKKVRQRIADRRLELGLSYQELGDIVGMSKSTLQRYETGDIGKLSIDKIEILARALKVTPAYLMGWEEKAPYMLAEEKVPYEAAIAAHFDGEMTDEDLDAINDFIEYKLLQRNKKK